MGGVTMLEQRAPPRAYEYVYEALLIWVSELFTQVTNSGIMLKLRLLSK